MYYDRFDIVDAHYWWNVNHHADMSSWGYKRQCHIESYFTPRPMANGPDTENAQEIYSNLCDREGCVH